MGGGLMGGGLIGGGPPQVSLWAVREILQAASASERVERVGHLILVAKVLRSPRRVLSRPRLGLTASALPVRRNSKS